MTKGMSESVANAIVILSYNHPEITARCIQSVLQCQALTRICVYHNGSTAENVQALKKRFPQVEHWVHDKNFGFSGGANRALNLAFKESQWVLFLTNDCQLSQIQFPAEAGFYGLPIKLRQTERLDSYGAVFNPRKAKLRHCRSVQDWQNIKSGEIRYIPGTAFLLDQKTWQSLPGFEESLGTYWEDVDLSVKAQQMAISVKIWEQAEIRHAVGKTCHKHALYSLYYFQKNRRKISFRYSRGLNKIHTSLFLATDHLRLSSQLLWKKRWKDFVLLQKSLSA